MIHGHVSVPRLNPFGSTLTPPSRTVLAFCVILAQSPGMRHTSAEIHST